MSEGRTPPLQDPGGLHSFKTMSPPLQDNGGLHVYSLNGGAHKMAEIVPQSPVAMGMTSQAGSEIGLYSSSPLSSNYQMDGDLQNVPYIEVEPLAFSEQGRMYEELKRPSPPQVQYFGNLENIHNSNNMYNHNSNSYSSVGDMFKPERDNLGGYVELLGNSDSLMNIKREKPDYNEHMGMGNNQPQEMGYPPNTCVNDWNYYNSMSNDSGFQDASNHNQGGYGVFQAGPSYHAGMVNNLQMMPQLPSNVDIHNQSKKITQSIIGTEWSQESLFKSRLYSNFDTQSNGRKRKNDSERGSNKNVRSRRKKSSDLGGHSKTVASILTSDNTSNYTKSENTILDSNVLDSTERNELVTKLMNNLRTTVQFESFCLSFPRNDVTENAFRCKVLDTANLIESLDNKSIYSTQFPANFIMGASKCLLNFNNALRNSGNRVTNEEEGMTVDSKNRSVEQVEEHLPHSMIWVIKTGDNSLMANWEGQFVAAVNPVQNILSLTVFQFIPSFSGEGIKCLQQAKLSKDLAIDIVENMEQFEVSRQLRCDISLKSITKLYLYKQNGDENEGCLIIEVNEKARYFQRWLHTSADDKNKWRERTNFISKTYCSPNQMIWIGGLVSELNELVAMMLASSPELEQIYKAGISHPLVIDQDLTQVNGIDVEENGTEKADIHKTTINRSQRQRRPARKLGSNVIKLRAEITEVLKSHIIIKANAANINSIVADGKEENSADSLGIYLDENLCCCFRDYINYSCDSAIELNSILQQKVNPRNHGFYENDFDLSLVPDGNIDSISVGELISSRCSEVVYFSFCAKNIGQLGYERHCSACRTCRTMQFWHCYACDRCSESRQVCEYCGHLRDDQSRCVVKPLSVFKSQVASGTLTLDNIKKEWEASLNFPVDDVITLAPPTINMNITERMEYNSSNAMIDQLGLLNPVGFLLGQPTSGASRKHRRYKVGPSQDKLPQGKAGGPLSGSSCSVQ